LLLIFFIYLAPSQAAESDPFKNLGDDLNFEIEIQFLKKCFIVKIPQGSRQCLEKYFQNVNYPR